MLGGRQPPAPMPIGELAALATALFWAFTGLFFAEAARRLGALRVNLLRLPLALVFLTLTMLAGGPDFAALDGRRTAYLAVSGVVGLVIGDLALFEALRRIGARLALLVMALAPVFAAAAGLVLLHERPGPRVAMGIVVTLAGVAWVVGERRAGAGAARHDTRGVALALLGAACQGIGLVLAKVGMAGEVPALTGTWVRMGAATALIWALTAATGRTRGLEVAAAVRTRVAVRAGRRDLRAVPRRLDVAGRRPSHRRRRCGDADGDHAGARDPAPDGHRALPPDRSRAHRHRRHRRRRRPPLRQLSGTTGLRAPGTERRGQWSVDGTGRAGRRPRGLERSPRRRDAQR